MPHGEAENPAVHGAALPLCQPVSARERERSPAYQAPHSDGETQLLLHRTDTHFTKTVSPVQGEGTGGRRHPATPGASARLSGKRPRRQRPRLPAGTGRTPGGTRAPRREPSALPSPCGCCDRGTSEGPCSPRSCRPPLHCQPRVAVTSSHQGRNLCSAF